MAPHHTREAFCTYLVFLTATACGSDEASDFAGGPDAGSGRPECLAANECPTGWTCSEFGTCVAPPNAGDAGIAEEVELELPRPVHSERFVYAPMPTLDALARIDGTTLEITSVPVGDQPEILAPIPGTDGVIVLDPTNANATIVTPHLDGDGDRSRVVATLPHMNRVSVDPTGSFAVAWFDLRQAAKDAGGLGAVGNIGSFQDVTVIQLARGKERSVDMTVGFRPRQVKFSSAGDRGLVVTDKGISVLPFTEVLENGPSLTAPIPVADASVDPLDVDVNITANGALAVVRQVGQAEVRIIELTGDNTGTAHSVALPAPPTDVDVSEDGLIAYAVVRETSNFAIIDLNPVEPGAYEANIIDLGSKTVGSLELGPQGKLGALYSNAEEVESVTIIHLDTPEHTLQTVALQKSVRTVQFSPDGNSLVVLHAKAPGNPREDGIDFDTFVDRSEGYSIIDLQAGIDKPQLTQAPPLGLSFSATSPRAYVIFDTLEDNELISQIHVIELDSHIVRSQPLSSPAESVGTLPNANVAFVNQHHPLGRISFLNLATDEMRTVTGFDLNSRIVD